MICLSAYMYQQNSEKALWGGGGAIVPPAPPPPSGYANAEDHMFNSKGKEKRI